MLAPFLFPFVMEYCLLALATMYSMYADAEEHVVKDSNELKSSDKVIKSQQKAVRNDDDETTDMRARVYFTEINFHKSHRGLFLGLLLLVGIIISTVLFFVYINIHSASNYDSYMSQVLPLIISSINNT